MNERERLARWRLVAGAGSEQLCGGLEGDDARRDVCLGFLYGREYGAGRNVRGPGRPERRSG